MCKWGPQLYPIFFFTRIGNFLKMEKKHGLHFLKSAGAQSVKKEPVQTYKLEACGRCERDAVCGVLEAVELLLGDL